MYKVWTWLNYSLELKTLFSFYIPLGYLYLLGNNTLLLIHLNLVFPMTPVSVFQDIWTKYISQFAPEHLNRCLTYYEPLSTWPYVVPVCLLRTPHPASKSHLDPVLTPLQSSHQEPPSLLALGQFSGHFSISYPQQLTCCVIGTSWGEIFPNCY